MENVIFLHHFLKVHLKTIQMLCLKDIEFSTTAQNMHQDVAHTVTHSNDFGLRSDKCHNTPKVAKKWSFTLNSAIYILSWETHLITDATIRYNETKRSCHRYTSNLLEILYIEFKNAWSIVFKGVFMIFPK